MDSRMPDGTPLQVLTQVLVPPAGSPEVVRHDDGSVTVSGDGVRQTMDARTAGMMEQMYRTPLTEAEVHRERRRLCATAPSRSWPPGSARRPGTRCQSSWVSRAATGLRRGGGSVSDEPLKLRSDTGEPYLLAVPHQPITDSRLSAADVGVYMRCRWLGEICAPYGDLDWLIAELRMPPAETRASVRRLGVLSRDVGDTSAGCLNR
ncbi:hypothetical protein ACFUMJ_24335 [Streptomyces olivaceus]|uniref:hypothetical protein n=1 Tax=Streptomyces TaxID=1883 RepID=UPI001FB573BE|nr:hypothetical protein [Streptomyces sp. CB09030]UOG82838.1 hypothetical protein L6J92_28235 [Streptomyces sp. CB09030]